MISFLRQSITQTDLLFENNFEKTSLEKKWEVTRGCWKVHNGALYGSFHENSGGIIYSRASFPGDIMLDYYGTMLAPCDNDLNFSFRANGWDYQKNDAGVGYIGGLNGWWLRHAGIERYPDCKLSALCNFRAESDREYHIQTGIVGNFCFLAVDSVLILTMSDPDPICSPDCTRVGLGTYCSSIRIRNFRVYRAVSEYVSRRYVPAF